MGSGSVDRSSRWRSVAQSAVPWVVVAAFVVVGIFSVVPPAAVSSDAPATEFSAARAVAHIEVIAREPHPMGSTAIAEVRDYIVDIVRATREPGACGVAGLDGLIETGASPRASIARVCVPESRNATASASWAPSG